ncbi:MAG: ATP-binding cassette domain-containing protein [Lachnoclostridium sp.]|jgi:ABC-2 type transport system ATP-binding protein|nr:ATP-binding cassette domain-containing protein [Lachnoclostridium sp.]
MDIIQVKDLSKTYKTYKRESSFGAALKSFFRREPVTIHAVDTVSFTIQEGEICGILGPNGAGKSTTIKMLCGALYPTSGKIEVMGYEPATQRKKYVMKIGAVFGQRSQLVWDIPPMDSFHMNKAIYGIPTPDFKKRLDELTDLFEVEEVIHKPTRVLSLGERMKCEFIMAMLHRPYIVFLDEPTIGLDVIAKAKIREFINRVNRDDGTTFILTTHDLEDVKQLADHVIIINQGKKVFDDPLKDLQTSLGEKKIVEMTLDEPFQAELIQNIKILQKKSPRELTMEVDTSKIAISDFIEEFSKKVGFSDISIKELPMEEIITHIYKESNNQ